MSRCLPTLSPEPLESWVKRARSGEQRAFAELYLRFETQLGRRVAKSLATELGHHLDAEDILQETFLSAFRALDRHEFRCEAAFLAWLARIAERKVRDALRFHRREKRTPQAGYFERQPGGRAGAPAELSAPAPDLLEDLGERELGRIAARALEELRSDLQAVLLLRELHGLSWREVGERLGQRTVGAARHLHGVACGELARVVKAALGELPLGERAGPAAAQG